LLFASPALTDTWESKGKCEGAWEVTLTLGPVAAGTFPCENEKFETTSEFPLAIDLLTVDIQSMDTSAQCTLTRTAPAGENVSDPKFKCESDAKGEGKRKYEVGFKRKN
jgi:hypothetical protein